MRTTSRQGKKSCIGEGKSKGGDGIRRGRGLEGKAKGREEGEGRLRTYSPGHFSSRTISPPFLSASLYVSKRGAY